MLKKLIPLLLVWPLMTGCSTIVMHLEDGQQVSPYGGTKKALAATRKSWREYSFVGEPVFYAFDVPLCLIADTLLLPYDYFQSR